MRNQPLTGYLLHHKPHQEKRALYYFFTQSHGVVHGMGKKGMPLFTSINLFATGKRSLRSFSQIQPTPPSFNETLHQPPNQSVTTKHTNVSQINSSSVTSRPKNQITGQNVYAGFYLNEILWKLLESEYEMSGLWLTYQVCLDYLRQADLSSYELRLLLRQFERILFNELGYAIDFHVDSQSETIQPNMSYRFMPEEGFEPFITDSRQAINNSQATNDSHSNKLTENLLMDSRVFSGESIIAIDKYLQSSRLESQSEPQLESGDTILSRDSQNLDSQTLQQWSRLHKQFIDYLMGYKPLQSRELWRQFSRFN